MSVNVKLINALDEILSRAEQSLKEYDVITQLQNEPYVLFDKTAFDDSLNLFHCHFVIFHHLYLLQEQYLSQGRGYLTVHTMGIHLSPLTNVSNQITQDDKLKAYYLDWSNFENTDTSDVNAMLESFWQRMGNRCWLTDEDRERALEVLNLNDQYTQEELRKQYRKLQHQFHPDKRQGSTQRSQNIDWAYRALKI